MYNCTPSCVRAGYTIIGNYIIMLNVVNDRMDLQLACLPPRRPTNPCGTVYLPGVLLIPAAVYLPGVLPISAVQSTSRVSYRSLRHRLPPGHPADPCDTVYRPGIRPIPGAQSTSGASYRSLRYSLPPGHPTDPCGTGYLPGVLQTPAA